MAVFGDEIALGGRSETALRAKREIFHGDEFCGFVDASGKLIGIFHSRDFGADEAENDGFAFGKEAQRFERAGAVVVVFEEEPVDVERGEHFLSDRVVAAFGVPVAAIVAAAKMDGERDSGTARGAKAGIVGFDGFVERGIGLDAHLRFNPLAPFRIHVVAVARRVDLDVIHAVAGKLCEIAFHDVDDGPQKFRVIFVNGVGDAAFEGDGRKLRGAWQGHFDRAGSVRFCKGQLVAGERADLAKFFGDDAGDGADGSRSGIAGVPASRDGVAEIEAFDGVGEVAHEIAAAQFSIGENLEAEFLLFCENAEDVLVLEPAKAFGVRAGLARLQQIGRPEQTAYVVSANGVRHVLLVLPPKLDAASGSMTVPKFAGPRLKDLESLAAKSRSKGIFFSRSGPTNRSVGPAMPRAAMTRPPL